MVPRAPITNGNVFVLIRPTFVQPSRFPSITTTTTTAAAAAAAAATAAATAAAATTTREVEVETYSTAAKSLTCALKMVLWHAIIGKSTNEPTCQNVDLKM